MSTKGDSWALVEVCALLSNILVSPWYMPKICKKTNKQKRTSFINQFILDHVKQWFPNHRAMEQYWDLCYSVPGQENQVRNNMM